MIIAQFALGTPIVVALVHRNTVGHWQAYGDAMLVDGASRGRTIGPLMKIGQDGLLTAWLAAFGRAISEVGAIIIVGGNVRGYTRTMTTAIALETSKGDLSLALALGDQPVEPGLPEQPADGAEQLDGDLGVAVGEAPVTLGAELPVALRPADAAALASDYPDILIILDHAGMPIDRDEDGILLWQRGMRKLAAAPNVVVKISGLGTADWNWTVKSIRPFVLETIEAFGVSRCMFASNFPVDKLYSDFDTLYSAFRQITEHFSVDECRMLFHDNAAHYYRL